MADEGLIDSSPGRAFHKTGGVPKVTVLRVVEVDDSGNVWAVPEQWHAERPPPQLRVIERGRRSALGIGDRMLARTEEQGAGLRRPSDEEARALGRAGARRRAAGGRRASGCRRSTRRSGASCSISDLKDAEAGDLVLCEVAGRPPRVSARVDAVLGDPFAPRSFILIAIHKHGLRARIRAGGDRRGASRREACRSASART